MFQFLKRLKHCEDTYFFHDWHPTTVSLKTLKIIPACGPFDPRTELQRTVSEKMQNYICCRCGTTDQQYFDDWD